MSKIVLFALVVDVPALDDLGEEGPHDRRELLGVGIGEDVQGRPVRQRPDHVLRDGGRRLRPSETSSAPDRP